MWDLSKIKSTVDALLAEAPDEISRARLLAVSCSESGAWLNALPVPSLGLRMDDRTVRIAVGLRLGTPLCHPHQCHHCGANVDHLATHGLSCRRSDGRHPRHASINDIIHRSLTSARVPSRLEPSDLYRSDGNRPDGVSLVPWKRGRVLVWDANCPDTFAPSYIARDTTQAGAVAKYAEQLKKDKYSHLEASHHFIPVAVESSGVFGLEAQSFVKELGRLLFHAMGDQNSKQHLYQRISIAVQRGNAAAVLGSLGPSDYFIILFL